jgi:predicted ArsR family transcriptional regulator
MPRRRDRSLASLAPLADPVRRALYELVAASPTPVDRDAAAAGAGIARPLAAFHLDKLVTAGLLETEYRRRGTRTGPGAGRPAKFYRRANLDVEVSVPPRRYDVAGEILAGALEDVPAAAAAVRDRARAEGMRVVEEARPGGIGDVIELLRAQGYEPLVAQDGTIRLRNCPFDSLVSGHRDLVCHMNHAMLDAVIESTPTHAAVLAPEDGYCCVALVPEADADA